MSKGMTLHVLAVLLVGTVGLAGCADQAPSSTTAPATDAAPAESGNVTVDDGTSEMPKDLGAMPHAHDYWMGRDRVTLLDEEVSVDAFSATFFTFFNVFGARTPALGGALVELPDGNIVYEGTGKLELTATWTEATVTGMGVRHRSAASPDFSEPAALTSGQPLVIDVTPEMSDMPHEKTSRWSFLLAPAQAGQSMVGSFHLKVDIVRMRDIESFPGHPDLFAGGSTLVLYDGPATSKGQGIATRLADAAVNGFGGPERGVRPTAVVPMETATMTANVTVTSATATAGKASGLAFYYKPADTNRWFEAELLGQDEATGAYQFAWPVEMAQTDSPYAKSSQWAFDVQLRTDVTGLGGQCGGCTDTQVEYVLTVVAYDAPLEGVEAPDEDEDDEEPDR